MFVVVAENGYSSGISRSDETVRGETACEARCLHGLSARTPASKSWRQVAGTVPLRGTLARSRGTAMLWGQRQSPRVQSAVLMSRQRTWAETNAGCWARASGGRKAWTRLEVMPLGTTTQPHHGGGRPHQRGRPRGPRPLGGRRWRALMRSPLI